MHTTHFKSVKYTRIPSYDSEEEDTLRADVVVPEALLAKVVPSEPPKRIFYVSSLDAKVIHDTEGHYNANIPITDPVGRTYCHRCRLGIGLLIDVVLTEPPKQVFYSCTLRCRVIHETKGHYGANIPITDTVGRGICSRCRLGSHTDPQTILLRD